MASLKILIAFLFASVNCQTLINQNVIEDGRQFTVTCDATRAGVPATAKSVVSLSIAWTAGTAALTTFATYNTLAPPYNSTSIPSPPRNWTFTFSGSQQEISSTPNNRNTMKIEMVVYDAKCTDAGLYFCNATYFSQIPSIVITSTFQYQNVSSITRAVPVSLALVPQNQGEHGPFESVNLAGSNVTLTCRVNGPRALTFTWKYGHSSSDVNSFTSYPVQNDISVDEPVLVSSGTTCVQYRHTSTLKFQTEDMYDGYMYVCVATENNEDTIVGNMTIFTKSATPAPSTNDDPAGASTNVGAIVGPIIGGLVLIAIIVVVVYFCWYRKRDTNKDKDREPDATDSNVHAPPPTFYAKPHKQPKEEKDNTDSGKINKGLDLSYENEDSRGPPRYTNTVDDDNEPPRYDRGRSNKGYDEDNNKEERSRRHRDREDRKDREGRKSRSRDPDEEPRRRYSTDDNTDNRAPYGDPGMGTAI